MTRLSLWTAPSPLILASKSAARLTLLNNAGLFPIVHTAEFDERSFEATLNPSASVTERANQLAVEKARLVSLTHHDAYVIGADQMLDCDGQILHKASTLDEAQAQLAFLSSRQHRLTSAVAVCRNGVPVFSQTEEAHLTMRQLTPDMIRDYSAMLGDTLLHTVGGYELEALGVHLFDRIEGSFFAILGLPLEPLLAYFRREHCLALS
jgi:septum formation protein